MFWLIRRQENEPFLHKHGIREKLCVAENWFQRFEESSTHVVIPTD